MNPKTGIAEEIREIIDSLKYKQQHSDIARDALKAISSLLEENERLKFGVSPLEPMIKLQAELQQLREELEQVKKERDEWEKGELKHYSSDMEDTIQSLRSEQVEKEMNAVCLRCFAKEVIQTAFNGGNLDGGEIQELGVKHHLLVEERYNPEKHGENTYAELGDPWFVYSEVLTVPKAIDATADA